MQIGVLATNGGKHSNEKLAIAVATDIVNIGANASGEQAIDARKLENKIVEVMEVLFAKLADFEHGQIAAKGTLHLASSLDAHPELKEEAVKAILAEIKASPFASWFSAEAAESYVSASIDKWLKVGHHMHRDWFAAHGKVGNGTDLTAAPNHDPNCEHVKRWKDFQHGTAAVVVQAVAERGAILAGVQPSA